MQKDEIQTDVAIIGAGPVGLFAVFQLGMLRIKAHVVDALPEIGGQCIALYPEKPIYDIPGFPKIMAAELIEQLQAQIQPFAPSFTLGQRVETLEQGEDGFRLTTSGGASIACKAVVIAGGAGAFGPNRPPLDRLAEFEATGAVQYLVRRREDYRGKRIVIAGGGDSAVDWAISLHNIAAKVYVVHRRDKFRAAPAEAARMQSLAEAGKIELVVPYQLADLDGAQGRLAAVVVDDLKGGTRRLEADHLLAFFGLAMNLGPIGQWGLSLDRSHIIVDPATCATSTPGIFAIGDMASYPGKLKLILSGFSEAAMAAHAIHPLVHKGEALHFQYSTSQGVPG